MGTPVGARAQTDFNSTRDSGAALRADRLSRPEPAAPRCGVLVNAPSDLSRDSSAPLAARLCAADLIIFDCDGVLVDSERLVNRVESECLRDLGLPLSPQETRAMFMGKTTAQVLTVIESRMGAPVPAAWVHDWGLWTAAALVSELRAVDGVAEVLRALAARSIRRCVASQSPLARVQLSLQVTGLAPHFGLDVFTASMVPRPKPAPDLFLHAAARLGVEPARCVVIEDSPGGVAAAQAAGMEAIGYAADASAEALHTAGAGRAILAMRELLQ